MSVCVTFLFVGLFHNKNKTWTILSWPKMKTWWYWRWQPLIDKDSDERMGGSKEIFLQPLEGQACPNQLKSEWNKLSCVVTAWDPGQGSVCSVTVITLWLGSTGGCSNIRRRWGKPLRPALSPAPSWHYSLLVPSFSTLPTPSVSDFLTETGPKVFR